MLFFALPDRVVSDDAMKSCPTCNRTYPDDTLAFCLVDGSILSAPYDPVATNSAGAPRDTNPPATEVFNPGASLDSLPPTQTAPRDVQSTIRAPFVQQRVQDERQPGSRVPEYVQHHTDYPRRKSSVVKKLLIVLAGIVVLLVAVFLFLEIMFATHQSTTQNIMPPRANTNATANSGSSTVTGALADEEAKVREQLRTDPDNARLNERLAQILLVQGKYSQSEPFARKAIRLNPNYSAPHYILSGVLEHQGKQAESEAERKKAEALKAKGY